MPTTPVQKGNHIASSRCMVALLFLALLSGAFPYQQRSPQPPLDAPYTVSVCVDMVLLHATVLDRKGNPMTGLVKENFEVYEDGILQQIEYFSQEDIPVTAGLVIDNSGTMGPKRREVIASALAFARSSNPEDQMFVVNFNEKVSFGLPETMPFTDEMDRLTTALSGIAANGMTALYDAVADALNHLQRGNRSKKALIVISDGGDNASKRRLSDVLSMAARSDAIIYTIGVFDENDPDHSIRALKQLAKATGGEPFLPRSAGEVFAICKRIARDLRSQYSIAYLSTNKNQDGRYRAVHVKAGVPKHGRLFVRTRAGYHAPLSPQPLPSPEQPREDPD